MRLLKRLLYLQALIWAASGLGLAFLPGVSIEVLLGQPPVAEQAWLRFLGIHAFALALVMVMVAHRIEQLWWWSWAFAIVGAGMGTVATLNVAFDLPPGASAWAWWMLGLIGWGFAIVLAWALAYAGQENPVV